MACGCRRQCSDQLQEHMKKLNVCQGCNQRPLPPCNPFLLFFSPFFSRRRRLGYVFMRFWMRSPIAVLMSLPVAPTAKRAAMAVNSRSAAAMILVAPAMSEKQLRLDCRGGEIC